MLFALRRRAVKSITSRIQVNATDALAILNTPSWRLSAWRRSPAASLLAVTPAAAVLVAAPSAAADADEAKTRVSARAH